MGCAVKTIITVIIVLNVVLKMGGLGASSSDGNNRGSMAARGMSSATVGRGRATELSSVGGITQRSSVGMTSRGTHRSSVGTSGGNGEPGGKAGSMGGRSGSGRSGSGSSRAGGEPVNWCWFGGGVELLGVNESSGYSVILRDSGTDTLRTRVAVLGGKSVLLRSGGDHGKAFMVGHPVGPNARISVGQNSTVHFNSMRLV